MKKLLALDLSTTSTGYAVFNLETKGLVDYGLIVPKIPGIHKLRYPKAALLRIIDVSKKVADLVAEINPDQIVIEEVNRGVNRISQKSLDALHFLILYFLKLKDDFILDKVCYIDSNGKCGWRGVLDLKLTEMDKIRNGEARKAKKKSKLKPVVVTWKHLASRYVKAAYDLDFDVDKEEGNADLVDAICLGTAYFKQPEKG